MRRHLSPFAPDKLRSVAENTASDGARSNFPLSWKIEREARPDDLWLANSFDEHEISLVTASDSEVWESLSALMLRGISLPLAVLAPLYQLEQSYTFSTMRLHIPSLSLPPQRISAIPTLLSQLPVDAIVVSVRDLTAVRPLCGGRPHVSFSIFASIRDEIPAPAPQDSIEVHLLPGLTGLFQCPALVGSDSLHPSDRFLWEFDDTRLFVTDGRETPRFVRAELPRQYHIEERTCSCGRALFITTL